jgi:hypothetical protein
MTARDQSRSDDTEVLNIFCTPQDEAWRVYASPTWLPRYLARCFDQHGEAYPVYLDFEDLDRYMEKRGLAFEKRASARGDVELTARGRAAVELAVWLSMAFASGFRQEADPPRDNKVPRSTG